VQIRFLDRFKNVTICVEFFFKVYKKGIRSLSVLGYRDFRRLLGSGLHDVYKKTFLLKKDGKMMI
jgi:hypothetical protein